MTDPIDPTATSEPPPYEQPTEGHVAAPGTSGRIAAILIGIAVLVGGTFAAVMVANEGGKPGPVAAVRDMYRAIADEDVIGVLESLDPAERDALRPSIESISDDLQRLGVLADDLDLSDLSGVEIELDGLEFDSRPMTDDLVAVTVRTGTITSSATPADLPLGRMFEEMLTSPEAAEATPPETESLADDSPTLVAARRDGSWHVSIAWSIADAIIQSDPDLELPRPEEWFTPEGAESPEAVLTELIGALEGLDLAKAMNVLHPIELEPLHAFAPTILEESKTGRDEAFEGGLEIEVTDITTEVVSQDGDEAAVALKTFSLRASMPEEGTISYSFDGNCASVDVRDPDGNVPTEIEELAGTPAYDLFGGSFCLDDIDPEMPFASFYGGFDPSDFALQVARHDGRWYLSPWRSTLKPLAALLSGIPDDGIENLIEDFEEGLGGLFGATSRGGFEFSETVEFSDSGDLSPNGGGIADDFGECFDQYGRDVEAWQRATEQALQQDRPLPPAPSLDC